MINGPKEGPMRIVILVTMLLAGCAPGQFYSPERIAERVEAGRRQQAAQAQAEAAYANSELGRADLGCRAKTQFAMAGWQARSILDLEGTARANQMHASCMDYWRQTGRLP
jgi:outer membrane murein-binding lipoprotein Lpp